MGLSSTFNSFLLYSSLCHKSFTESTNPLLFSGTVLVSYHIHLLNERNNYSVPKEDTENGHMSQKQ